MATRFRAIVQGAGPFGKVGGTFGIEVNLLGPWGLPAPAPGHETRPQGLPRRTQKQ